jgi:hypothetical protein
MLAAVQVGLVKLHFLACGAYVVALDYSTAVDACWENLGPCPRRYIVKDDIYCFSSIPNEFDFVYCLGAFQHTPFTENYFKYLSGQHQLEVVLR